MTDVTAPARRKTTRVYTKHPNPHSERFSVPMTTRDMINLENLAHRLDTTKTEFAREAILAAMKGKGGAA